MSDEEAVVHAQRETQRLLGRCLLRIQQYERLLKAVLSASDVAIVAGGESAACVNRRASFSTMTLGGLASELFNSVVVVDAPDSDGDEPLDETEISLSARVQYSIVMDAEKLAATQAAVNDMVQLRNGLFKSIVSI